jgi:hypothetical protein
MAAAITPFEVEKTSCSVSDVYGSVFVSVSFQ